MIKNTDKKDRQRLKDRGHSNICDQGSCENNKFCNWCVSVETPQNKPASLSGQCFQNITSSLPFVCHLSNQVPVLFIPAPAELWLPDVCNNK